MTDDPVDPHEPFENTDDVDGLDLTPRQAPPVGGGSTDRGRRLAVVGVLTVLAFALIFMAYQGLSNASVFYRNADEAVAERDSLGDKRFRLRGRVVEGSVQSEGNGVLFTVVHNGVEVDVSHRGDPPEMFQPDIPVVVEGRWSGDGDWIESDRVLVAHEEEYEAENPERVAEYEAEEADDR